MDEIQKAKLEGARAILRALTAQCEVQAQPGVSVVLIKQLAVASDDALVPYLENSGEGKC